MKKTFSQTGRTLLETLVVVVIIAVILISVVLLYVSVRDRAQARTMSQMIMALVKERQHLNLDETKTHSRKVKGLYDIDFTLTTPLSSEPEGKYFWIGMEVDDEGLCQELIESGSIQYQMLKINNEKDGECPGNVVFYFLKNPHSKGSSSSGESQTPECPFNAICENGGYIPTGCVSGYFLQDTSCVRCPQNSIDCEGESFECLDGFYKNGNECESCGAHVATCDSTGKATSCSDNYYGENCENAPLTCQNDGTWDTATHTCNCVNGYKGEDCSAFDSCYNVDCGDHGSCVNGSCVCRDNYYGTNCENAPLTCQNGGSWNSSTHVCDCVNGYSGTTCETKEGTCTSYADCKSGEYCQFSPKDDCTKGVGQCASWDYDIYSYTASNGVTYQLFKQVLGLFDWHTSNDICASQNMKLVSLSNFVSINDCTKNLSRNHLECPINPIFSELYKNFGGLYTWSAEDSNSNCGKWDITINSDEVLVQDLPLSYSDFSETLCQSIEEEKPEGLCDSYQDCKSGEYCQFSPESSTTDPTLGECRSLLLCGDRGTYKGFWTTDDSSPYCEPDWWTAQDICQAKGMRMASLADLECTRDGCSSGGLRVELANNLTADLVWVTDLYEQNNPNSSEAFLVNPNYGLDHETRKTGDEGFEVLCISDSDPCANVDCGEHGTCSNGACVCDSGYSGTNCEIASNQQTYTCDPIDLYSVKNESGEVVGYCPTKYGCKVVDTPTPASNWLDLCDITVPDGYYIYIAGVVVDSDGNIVQTCESGSGFGAMPTIEEVCQAYGPPPPNPCMDFEPSDCVTACTPFFYGTTKYTYADKGTVCITHEMIGACTGTGSCMATEPT